MQDSRDRFLYWQKLRPLLYFVLAPTLGGEEAGQIKRMGSRLVAVESKSGIAELHAR